MRTAALALLTLVAAAPPPPAVSPVPMPSATPLFEIGRVRSRSLCTTLRENVAPALAKLIQADTRIETGRLTFVQMGRNEVLGAGTSLHFDRIKLGNAVLQLARDIGAADTLLADAKRFPRDPVTDDQRDAAAMKKQLQAVVEEQKHALNVLSGIYETDLMGEMQTDFPRGISAALAREGSRPTPAPERTSYIDAAGTGASTVTPAKKAGTDSSQLRKSLFGHTLYDEAAGQISRHQGKTALVELDASQAVTAAVADCRAPQPLASPSPLP